MVSRLPALAVAVSGFILYLLTAYPFPDWLDSPELITAAFRLGAFHPPGAPLAVLAGHLFSLWPFAPPATSLLYFSAVFAALALYVLTRIVQDLFKALGPDDQRPGSVTAVVLGAAFMLCSGLWSQAVRTEVYTLALFLFLGSLREILLAGFHDEDRPDRIWRAAALCGLGLCVHPLMALSIVPAVVLLAVRGRLGGQLIRSAIALALGAAPLLFIPLMAQTPGDLRFGDPTTLTGFFKYILGLTFSHSFTEAQTGDSGFTALAVVMVGLGPGLSILAALGLYPLIRKKPWLALLLILTAVASMLALALQRSVRFDNPDVSGYVLPAMAAVLLVAAVGLAVAARMLSGLRKELPWIAAALAAGSLVATVVPLDLREADRSGCHAGAHLAAGNLEKLPDNTLVLAADFNLVFALEYLIQVEGRRPDVEVRHLRDLDRPRLDRDFILHHSSLRPVAVDLGPHLDQTVLELLHPQDLFWTTTGSSSPAAVAPVCANGSADLRSADVVAWHFYWQALAAEKLDKPDLSRARLNRARCASPYDQSIAKMARRLDAQQEACSREAPGPYGSPPARRPPLLPAVLLLLGLVAWVAPLLFWRRAWLCPAVSLAGLIGMLVVLLVR